MACNRTFAEMLGYARKELLGQSFRMLYGSQEEFEQVRDIGLAPLRETHLYTDERMIRRQDGAMLWCRFRAHALEAKNPLARLVLSFALISESPHCSTVTATRAAGRGRVRVED